MLYAYSLAFAAKPPCTSVCPLCPSVVSYCVEQRSCATSVIQNNRKYTPARASQATRRLVSVLNVPAAIRSLIPIWYRLST